MRAASRCAAGLLLGAIVLFPVASCRGPAQGPTRGILVVLPEGREDEMADLVTGRLQRYVQTTQMESVFDFSFVERSGFEDDLMTRRTVFYIASDESGLPSGLSMADGVAGLRFGYDLWARGQSVFGLAADLLATGDPRLLGAVSDSLEAAYDRHMRDYVYGSFVSTQMSSPARLDSLSELGFTMDVPKSYSTAYWRPGDGFVQYQRGVTSDDLLLMLSVRWIDDAVPLREEEHVVRWREEVVRRFFFDAAADSVDRSRLVVEPVSAGGLDGWKLTGMWRNPEHLNAGAFSSYVLLDERAGRRFLLDYEVYHPHASKETYLREGWTIMNTFMRGGSDG